MEIRINVYADCTSEEPKKSYVVRRILFKTAKELAVIKDQSAKATEAEQEGFTLKMIQAVIPEFTEEDLKGVDPAELGSFFRQMGGEVSKVLQEASKN